MYLNHQITVKISITTLEQVIDIAIVIGATSFVSSEWYARDKYKQTVITADNHS